MDGNKGPGLFDAFEPCGQRAYRTTTPDSEHLAKSSTAGNAAHDLDVHFAELRANEFMGSLLVPRPLLSAAAEELAPEYNFCLHRGLSLDPEIPGTSLHLSTTDADDLEGLERALASRFGVNPRFVQVRLQRYGLIRPGAALR